jgi:hypothetical protein
VLPNLLWVPAGVIPSRLMTIAVMTDFFAILLGVTFGSLLYREEDASAARSVHA